MKRPNDRLTTPNDDEMFFLAESIRHARKLPLPQCRSYLAGFLRSLGIAHPAKAQLIEALGFLSQCDTDFDNIQAGIFSALGKAKSK